MDAKTNDLLEEYKKKKDEKRKVTKVKEEGEDNSDDDGEDSEQKRDAEAREQLEAIVREHHSDLHKNADGFGLLNSCSFYAFLRNSVRE